MKTYRVVLVYNMVPEHLQVYDLVVNKQDFDMLVLCHSQYCNSVDVPDDHPVNTLSEWLEKHKGEIVYDDSSDDNTVLPPARIGGDTTLIVSGFIL